MEIPSGVVPMGSKLAILSDIHMRDGDVDDVHDALAGAKTHIQEFEPDRTIVLGDLIQDADPEGDRRHIEVVIDQLAALEPRYLAGNHDTEHLSPDELEDLFGNELWGHETLDAVDLVYLDSSAAHLPKARSEISKVQLGLLKSVLQETRETLVFVHHPIHYRDIRSNPWFGERPELAFCASKAWVQQLFDHYGGVCATFNGHVHENNHTQYRGIDHFTINAVNKERPDSNTVTGTYALVSLADRLSVEVYDRTGFIREWSVPRGPKPHIEHDSEEAISSGTQES